MNYRLAGKSKRHFGTPPQVVQKRPLLLVRGKRDPEEGSLNREVFCLASSIGLFRTKSVFISSYITFQSLTN